MVMMLRQCCCGCSLQTGAIIIGVLNIIGGLEYVLDGITCAKFTDHFDGAFKTEFVAKVVAVAVIGAILLLVSICLIVGAQKGNPALLVPWMVYTVVYLIAITILYNFSAVPCDARFKKLDDARLIRVAVIYYLLQPYFLLVVYSLYRELKGTAPPNTFW